MAWNYQQRKDEARRDYADAVEDARNGHANGNAEGFAKYRAEIAAATDLVSLGLVARQEPVKRRRVA
jgi:hypothetical protein